MKGQRRTLCQAESPGSGTFWPSDDINQWAGCKAASGPMLCGKLPNSTSLRQSLLLQVNSVSPVHLVMVHMQWKTAHMLSKSMAETGVVSAWEDSIVYKRQRNTPSHNPDTGSSICVTFKSLTLLISVRDVRAVIVWAMITIVPLTSVSYWSVWGKSKHSSWEGESSEKSHAEYQISASTVFSASK